MVLLLIVCWLGQLLCSERWRILAASLQMHGSYRSFVQMYFAGMFFNIGLPSLVGGDAMKAYILSRKNGKPLYVGLASVLQDRAAGLITLLLYGSIAILLFPLSWRGFPLWIAYLLSWIAVALALGLVLKGERLYRRFLIPGSRTLLQRVLRMIAEFHQALGSAIFERRAFPDHVLFIHQFRAGTVDLSAGDRCRRIQGPHHSIFRAVSAGHARNHASRNAQRPGSARMVLCRGFIPGGDSEKCGALHFPCHIGPAPVMQPCRNGGFAR